MYWTCPLKKRKEKFSKPRQKEKRSIFYKGTYKHISKDYFQKLLASINIMLKGKKNTQSTNKSRIYNWANDFGSGKTSTA